MPAPSSPATRRIETASKPSASAIASAAAAISLAREPRPARARLGPRPDRVPASAAALAARSRSLPCHFVQCTASVSYDVRKQCTAYGSTTPASSPRASASASATSGRCATSTSPCPPGRCSACSATTAPARRPRSGSSRRSPQPTEGRATRRRPRRRRRRRARAPRIGLAGQAATVDGLLTARANLEMVGRLYHLPRAPTRGGARTSCSSGSTSPTPPTGSCKTFSGGMRRRLDLAASLVAAPPVLFLDEPTTGLDPRSRNELWELLRELVARRHDARAHDAVPRGGRPARRRDRRARPRPHRRAPARPPSSRRGRRRARSRSPSRDAAELAAGGRTRSRRSPTARARRRCRRAAVTLPGATGHAPDRDRPRARRRRRRRHRRPPPRGDARRRLPHAHRRHAARGAPHDAADRRPRCSLRWLVSDSLVLARRNLAHVRQIPEKLLDVTLQPLMFVLLFAYVFGGVIASPAATTAST